MPVTISLVYNSNRDNSIYNARLGNGMQTNYNICLKDSNADLTEKGYKYYLIDADGTKHWFYFEKNASSGKDEDGLGYTLENIEANSDSLCPEARYRITDKDKNKMYFDSSKRFIQCTNANGISSKVSYYELGNGQFLLSRVYDGAGREYKFIHDFIDNTQTYYLKYIEDPVGRKTSFGYTDGCLTLITFPDGKSISLVHQYEHLKYLNKITDIDGNRINIEYDWTQAFRVKSFSYGDFNGDDLPCRYSFEYKQNETYVSEQYKTSDREDIVTTNTYTYQFNDFGQNTGIVSSADGKAQFFSYGNSKSDGSVTSEKNNKLLSSSKVITSVNNIARNFGFTDASLSEYIVYPTNGGNASIDTAVSYLDNNSLKLNNVSENGQVIVTQEFGNTAPGDYTFSAYVKTESLSGEGIKIGLKAYNGNSDEDIYVYSEPVKSTAGWQRVNASVSLEESANLKLICGMTNSTVGTAWIDNIQLEPGMGVSSYNMIENSCFSRSNSHWNQDTAIADISLGDLTKALYTSANLSENNTDALKAREKNLGLSQEIKTAGNKGDVYSVGAWVKAYSAPINSLKTNDEYVPKYNLALRFYNAAGTLVGTEEIPANADVRTWQYVSGKVIAPEDYSKIKFEVVYNSNINTVATTGAFCYKEEFGQTYTYDNNGNIVSSEDLAKSNSTFGYQGNNLSGMLNPSGSSYLYTYDDSNNINTAFSTDGLKYYLEYDGKGNVKNTVTKGVTVARDVIDTDKTYSIVNQLTSYALDMNNDHELINLRYQNLATHQWKFEYVRNGVYKIHTLDGHYIKVEDNAYGSKLKMTGSGDSAKCNLTVQPTGDGAFVISTASAGDCNYYLDSTDGSSFTADNYSAITQRVLRTPKNTSQKWYLIEDYTANDSNAKRMYSSAEYTTDDNYLLSQTDQSGNTTSYNYDSVRGTLDSVTNAAGNTTTYSYNPNNDNLLSVSAGGITNSYSYNNDRLTEINVNNATRYSFDYDQFGRTVSTSVGNGTNSVILSALEYNQRSLMTKQTYGNGDYIFYAYDSLDRLAEKSYNDKNGNPVAKKQYLYGNDGNISLTVDYATNSYTRYNYDLSGRTASVREYSGTDISSNTPISYTEYKYADKTNYLTSVKHFSPLGTQNIAYNYGNINNGQMPDQVYSVSWNGVNKLENSFDELSRLSTRKINGLATNYTYKDIGANQTTTLVKSIETSGITHTYEYDALGNITSIYDGSKTTTYKYDELNQLVRADNPYENKTHIYTYENGNITSDKVYAYTAGTSEPTNLKYTVQYSYGNEKWADVLTGVEKVYPQNSVSTQSLEQDNTPEIATRLLGENAQSYDLKSRLSLTSKISTLSDNEYYAVTSDEIGNITSYNGLNYTWVGRQLKSIKSAEDSSLGVTYSYNSDGQRIGKNLVLDGGETYDYDYYYNGDILSGYKLVITDEEGQASTHILTFMYDENGEAFGFNYNGNDYYYARNAQNDVVFITDSDNTGVVMYQYDAWGKITACYDTSDDGMLSVINPYTYRGYYYEIDTNSYFLKSRYYNPELCRFINADGYVQTGQGVLDKNMFAYCENNPISFCDDNGTFTITLGMVCIAILAFAVSFATGILINALSRKDESKGLGVIDSAVNAGIEQIPGGKAYNTVRGPKKTIKKIQQQQRQHAENVVNANYAKKRGLKFSVVNIDPNSFSSDEEYTKCCLNSAERLEESMMIYVGIDINGRNWNSLSEYEKEQVINLRQEWDIETDWNVDKNGAVIYGFGLSP